MNNAVTIVVPVYGDWESLSDCIESLLQNVDLTENHILLVNDCGPDVDMMEKNILSAIAGKENIRYERNKKNLGFVGTCNRAVLELDTTKNDILLLNSDTKVTPGFLQEMSHVLYASPKNGAVSPRSNNATLATIPLSSAPTKGIEPDESFALFLKIKKALPRSVTVPVAHGFCMLIRRSLVTQYGLFDTAFGKGYGEEVDFCQRIRKDGYVCLLANHAFVFHMEARSFSLETKAKLLEENNKIIWQRYPKYRDEVRSYMQQATASESAIEAKVVTGNTPQNRHSLMQRIVHRNKHIHRAAAHVRRKLK